MAIAHRNHRVWVSLMLAGTLLVSGLPERLPPPALAQTQQEQLALQVEGDRLLGQGLQQLSQKNWAAAAQSYQQAAQVFQKLGNPTYVSRAQEGLAKARLLAGNYAEAIAILQPLAAQAPLDSRGTTYTNLGLAQYRLNQFPNAEQSLRRAIAAWEEVRASNDTNDLDKVTLLEQQSHTYRLLQKVLIAQNRTDAALEINEASRGRTLVELLAQRRQTRVAPAPTINEIRQVAKLQNTTIVEYGVVGDEVRVLGDEPDTETDLFIWVIQPTGKITFRQVDLRPMQKQGGIDALNRSDPLADLIRNSRTALGVATRGLVFKENTETVTRVSTRANTSSTYPQLRQLHDLLIQPIADLLPQDPTAHVTFVPQGPLFLIPFAGLQDASGQYLIERHTILTSPSVQVLQLIGQYRQSQQGSMLIVGNPTMPKLAPQPGAPPQQLAALPGAETEAQAIATLLKTKPLLGGQATKAEVLKRMAQSRIIHLATHGILDLDPDLNEFGAPVDPTVRTARQSNVYVNPGAVVIGRNTVVVGGVAAEVALAREKVVRVQMPGLIALAPDGQDDGFLSAEALLGMKLQADLVVLSACNTGRGRVTGEGVIGLSRALIGAGVPSVVASLWAVPDAPTAALMIAFYEEWLQRGNKAQALRQAMLKTLKDYPDPRDWSAFMLIGEAD